MNQSELYQQLILDHNRKPRNFKKIDPCTHKAEGYNPLCGDHLWLYLSINEQSIIKDIGFTGHSCAICKSSTSVMTEVIKGKTCLQVSQLFETLQNFFKGELKESEIKNIPKKCTIFSSVSKYPTRIKCVSLGWHTLNNALKDSGTASTE